MLGDAISSEAYRLWRNKTVLFWAFLFVPFVAFGADLFFEAVVKPGLAQGMPLPKIDWPRDILSKFGAAGGFLTVVFAIVGASIIFTADYRWETWRLMAPRNGRINLMLGKLIVLMAGSLVALILVALFSIAGDWVATLITHPAIPSQGEAIPLGFYFLVLACLVFCTLLQVLVATGVVALFAVLTRSIVGAMLVGLVVYSFIVVCVLFAQQGMEFFVKLVGGADPLHPPFWRLLAWPEYSAQLLMSHVSLKAMSGRVAVEAGVALQALLALLVWIVVGFGGAIALFRRQDLSKE